MTVVDAQRIADESSRWRALIRRVCVSLCVGLTAALGGCHDAGPERAAVTGMVDVDGQPLDSGTITFIPSGPDGGSPSGSAITNGKYSIPKENGTVVGSHRVEIRWAKKTGKQIPAVPPATAPTDEVAEGLPEKFNTKSTLVETVESGPNTIDFHLKTD